MVASSRLTEEFSGRSITVDWDGEWDGDLVAALVTADGRSVTYQRGTTGQLEQVSTHAGDLHYAWDGNLLLSVTDNDGVAAFVNEYDADGRVIRQTSPFGRITSYTYQVPGATVIADERGVRQAMIHDGRGNLTAVVDVDGSAMRITYDDADRAVRVVSKAGAEWRYDFDPDTGDLLRRHDPDGLSQSWTWDDLGRPITDTDRTGAVTTFEYADGHRTPTRVTGPDGSTATAELNAAGRPVRVTDADGVVRLLGWDRDGQITTITDAAGAVTTFEFDAAGLLVRLIDPAGVDTRLDYERGRVSRSERGDAVSTYLRTPAGRIRGGTEPGDVPWSATFGPHGGMETITDGLGSTARYEYDSLGDVTAVIAPDGATYTNEFDAIGRLISSTDPTGATLRKGYDVEGRLVEFVDAQGGVMRRQLDVLGSHRALRRPRRCGHGVDLPPERRGGDRHRSGRSGVAHRDRRVRPGHRRHRSDGRPCHPRLQPRRAAAVANQPGRSHRATSSTTPPVAAWRWWASTASAANCTSTHVARSPPSTAHSTMLMQAARARSASR